MVTPVARITRSDDCSRMLSMFLALKNEVVASEKKMSRNSKVMTGAMIRTSFLAHCRKEAAEEGPGAAATLGAVEAMVR
jgi:hypothetical protein